ncbi:isochorismatase family protein [Ottowia testudinis]|uniref:Isochorismatase family protein n=1 Tax=Ottowia testudinis TaxID=2816950 RepID=A0A975CDL4_9BURK|nr:isochorismatase family protein [Ottowia testudinis]QTD44450.1 isochorismatase family protein [Ottowia testudinis]
MLLDAEDSQLVLIDYQARLMPVIDGGQAVLANARRLAQMARLVEVPVWATEQNPAKLGGTDQVLAALCDRIVPKMAFNGADALQPLLAPAPRGNARSLPRHLQKPQPAEPERRTIVIAGCETHVCLLQTALMLLEAEWDVWVVVDACGSRTERNRDAAFDRLAGAGCELVTTEMVGFEWLRDCEHPEFRALQALIK